MSVRADTPVPARLRSTPELEKAVGRWTRRHLPGWAAWLAVFVLKLGWASLFAGLLLIGLIGSKAIWNDGWTLQRYDALAIYAISLQALFLIFRLETWDEARVIILFHLTGTLMEMFKVNAGSWAYPEPGLLKIANVPLFTGFMYASVGSFMARAIRLFQMRFAPYPPFSVTVALAVAIYVNFFAHHYLPDARWLLFAATVLLYARTRVWFRVDGAAFWMPLPVAALLTAFFLWVAENVGTVTGTWIYPDQHRFDFVSLAKMGSWYLLIYVSFVTVTLVYREALRRR